MKRVLALVLMMVSLLGITAYAEETSLLKWDYTKDEWLERIDSIPKEITGDSVELDDLLLLSDEDGQKMYVAAPNDYTIVSLLCESDTDYVESVVMLISLSSIPDHEAAVQVGEAFAALARIAIFASDTELAIMDVDAVVEDLKLNEAVATPGAVEVLTQNGVRYAAINGDGESFTFVITRSAENDLDSSDSEAELLTGKHDQLDDTDDVLIWEENGISAKAYPTDDGLYCVFITNNSDEVVDDISATIYYMNEDSQVVDMDEDWQDVVLPGYTVVSIIDQAEDYSSAKLELKCEYGIHPDYENHSEGVSLSANEGEDCIIVQIQNNTDIVIEEIEYAVVYYRDGKVASVGYPKDVYDVTAGDMAIEKEYLPSVEFDGFEIFLNQAHTFGL